jgi:hypothetical protein
MKATTTTPATPPRSHRQNAAQILKDVLWYKMEPYGWDDSRTALPLRPDVCRFFEHALCRADGLMPLDFAGLPEPIVELTALGSIRLLFTNAWHSMIVHVPCEGVVLVKQFLDKSNDNVITTRLPHEFDAMAIEWEPVRAWFLGRED